MRFSSSLVASSVASVLALSPAFLTAADLQLIANGKSDYTIVTGDDAIPAEVTAAKELQRYLHEATGVLLPIQEKGQVPAGARWVVVGAGKLAEKLLPNEEWKALEGDGILIATKGDALVLSGDRPRGALYAVYEFLERDLGVRWWSPTVTKVPRLKELRVKDGTYRYRPPFVYREHYSTLVHGSTPERYLLGVRYRQNGIHQYIPEEWGGHFKILGEGHTFSKLVPMDQYFDEHPEYYTDPANGNKPCTKDSARPEENMGVRAAQLCLSNPDVLRIATETALRWIEEDPAAGIVSVTENDNSNYCACKDCAALAKKEGSQSGPILKFVNQIAAVVAEKHPGFLVETFAYNQGVKPPRTIRPGKNVLIRLAPLKADFGHPLDSEWNGDRPGVHENVRDGLRQWAAITEKLFVWNYITNFVYTIPPFPNWAGLGKDLRFFADNHVVGIFQQGDAATNDVGDMTPLRAYVVGKLMWNPQLDQDAVIDEFLAGYYEEAAPFLRRYIDSYQQSYLAQNRPLSSHDHDFSFLTLDVLTQANELFAAALKAVEEKPEVHARVLRERFSVDLSWLYRYKALRQVAAARGVPFAGPSDPLAALDDLKRQGREYEIRGKGEGAPFDIEEIRLEAMLAPNSADLPETVKASMPKGARPEVDLITLEHGDFITLREGIWANVVDDDGASKGRATQVLGGYDDYPLQFDFKNYGARFLNDDVWEVFAVVRTDQDPQDKTGISFSALLYSVAKIDTGTTGVVIDYKAPASVTAGGEWQTLKLGKAQLFGDTRMSIRSHFTPNVKAVYIDRIFLVRQKPLK